jgi:IS1 family transposase
MANVLSIAKQTAIITCLVEGCSVRSTSRMTGVSKGAVLRTLVKVGQACTEYHNAVVRNVAAKRVQVDEIWSFCYAKEKNATAEMWERVGYAGDVWTFTAIDADTKLVIGWLAGRRDAGCAAQFLQDVAARLSNRVQLTSDGHKMYLDAVPDAFGADVDFAQLVKIYGNDPEGQKRYSPAQCLGTKRVEVIGDPDPAHVSTSYVERQNLNMRMNMRRFTRLTNAFSKKLDNHVAMLALFHMHHNFARVHQTLRVTPAMEAGISSHAWSIQEIVLLAGRSQERLAA